MKRLGTIILLAVASTIIGGTVRAQDMGLKIGDRLPDFVIEKVINTGGKTVRTSDFRNKLLIVDFWATNCPGCVAALPKMASLQQQFEGKLAVLPVTYENQALVSAFWKANSYTRKLSLPSVVEDKKFSALFKHRSIPHEVWVYKGVVIGVTTAEYVDAHNIGLVLDGKKNDWPVKNDFYRFDAFREPLFTLDPAQVDTGSTFVKYAAISGYRSGVNSEGLSGGSGIVRDPVKRTVRAFFLNQPIYNSYRILAQQLQDPVTLIKPSVYSYNPNEVVWEVIDRSKYIWSKNLGYEQDWVRDNAICYESLSPDTGQTDQEVKKKIINDLNRLLGLNVRWEKRREKALILINTSAKGKPAVDTAGRNMFASDLVYMLNLQQTNPYVFNQIKDSPKQKLNINVKDWTDIDAVQKAIAPFGLALIEEERLVHKLMFSEVDGGLLIDRKIQVAAQQKRKAQMDMVNPTSQENEVFLAANKTRPGIMVLPSGLQYKILKRGTGPVPSGTDRVSVHFTGTLVNGKIFDSSMESGRPFTTAVKDVIEGWQQALKLMPVGSKWNIYVPAELAYGSHTNQGRIPPNSVLVFEIELLAILK